MVMIGINWIHPSVALVGSSEWSPSLPVLPWWTSVPARLCPSGEMMYAGAFWGWDTSVNITYGRVGIVTVEIGKATVRCSKASVKLVRGPVYAGWSWLCDGYRRWGYGSTTITLTIASRLLQFITRETGWSPGVTPYILGTTLLNTGHLSRWVQVIPKAVCQFNMVHHVHPWCSQNCHSCSTFQHRFIPYHWTGDKLGDLIGNVRMGLKLQKLWTLMVIQLMLKLMCMLFKRHGHL